MCYAPPKRRIGYRGITSPDRKQRRAEEEKRRRAASPRALAGEKDSGKHRHFSISLRTDDSRQIVEIPLEKESCYVKVHKVAMHEGKKVKTSRVYHMDAYGEDVIQPWEEFEEDERKNAPPKSARKDQPDMGENPPSPIPPHPEDIHEKEPRRKLNPPAPPVMKSSSSASKKSLGKGIQVARRATSNPRDPGAVAGDGSEKDSSEPHVRPPSDKGPSLAD